MSSPASRVDRSPSRARSTIKRLVAEAKRRTAPWRLRGDAVHCPFCERGYSRFLPAGIRSPVFDRESVVGGGRREGARCPHCLSLERERLMFLHRDRFMPAGARAPADLLHFAPEPSTRRRLERDAAVRYVTADLLADDVDLKLDVCALDLPDAAFDVVICNHVLEHVPDDGQAMREILRVLRPGGAAVLQVPIAVSLERTLEDPSVTTAEERRAVFGQVDHARLYGRDYRARLIAAGFELDELLPDPDTVARHGLDEREVLFVARRPG